MRRTLTTFLLLLVLFTCAFFVARCYDRKKTYTNTVSVPDVNKFLMDEYHQVYKQDIEQYRLGMPRFGDDVYVDPSTINPTFQKPRPFIKDFPKSLYELVPDDYTSTIDPTNVMFPGTADMNVQMLFDNILNSQAQSNDF